MLLNSIGYGIVCKIVWAWTIMYASSNKNKQIYNQGPVSINYFWNVNYSWLSAGL